MAARSDSCHLTLGVVNTFLALLISTVVAGCSAGRAFDDAPSVTGVPSEKVLATQNYETFVREWLGSPARTSGLQYGAFAQYDFTIQPPNRPGYNRVGGKEIDDAFNTMKKWCTAQGGKPVFYSVARGSDPRMAKFLGKPLSETPDAAFTACEQNGIAVAVIEVANDSDWKDRPAKVTVTHYSQQSVAQAKAKDEEVRAAQRARRAEQSAAADEARQQEDQQARERFARGAAQPLKVGDPVCTWATNAYGNVEQIEGSRVKVYVIGEAAGSSGYSGYFFYERRPPRLEYGKVEAPRWFERAQIAPCRFPN